MDCREKELFLFALGLRRCFFFLLFLITAVRTHASDSPAARSPSEVLLVYNAESPISKSVAGTYSQARKVTHVLVVHCVDSAVDTQNETIPMDVYIRSIETPIRDYLTKNKGIDFIVLTKGVPIRIIGSQTGCRDENSSSETPLRSSVDSYLAAMDYKEITGAVKINITGSGATGNGWLNRYYNAKEPFSHAKFGGYLVTRLDGYTEADSKALVARAIEAEHGLTYGKVLLDVQSGFGLGDKTQQPAPIKDKVILRESPWDEYNADMRHAHDILQKQGIPDELDLTPEFIGNRSNLLGYFSWGSNDQKYSKEAYESLSFAPGSVSDTAVSTSGRTFLPTSGGQSLLADLIAHGLTCGKGYTDEPLLQAMASPTILLDRYVSGYTMAESFYAASHFVGWEDVVIGDPLCCPFLGGANGKILAHSANISR